MNLYLEWVRWSTALPAGAGAGAGASPRSSGASCAGAAKPMGARGGESPTCQRAAPRPAPSPPIPASSWRQAPPPHQLQAVRSRAPRVCEQSAFPVSQQYSHHKMYIVIHQIFYITLIFSNLLFSSI